MNTSQRFDNVASTFSDRVAGVPDGAWDQPAPCEGWVARDVVRHLVDWVPGFLANFAGIDLPSVPSVDDDPVAAWETLRRALQSILDDPEEADREINGPAGPTTVADAIDRFMLSDVLVHTWDLARATDQDDTLDADEVERLLAGFNAMDPEMLVQSGQFQRAVPVPDDADPQTRLVAATGRQP